MKKICDPDSTQIRPIYDPSLKRGSQNRSNATHCDPNTTQMRPIATQMRPMGMVASAIVRSSVASNGYNKCR